MSSEDEATPTATVIDANVTPSFVEGAPVAPVPDGAPHNIDLGTGTLPPVDGLEIVPGEPVALGTQLPTSNAVAAALRARPPDASSARAPG